MATLKKNTQAAAEAAAPVKAKAAAPKAEPVPAVEAPAVAAEQYTKKDIASYIQEYVRAEGKAVPLPIATLAVEAYEQFVMQALAQGDHVRTTLGKFSVAERAARTARNPQTGEDIDVPAKLVPAFKASKGLKAAVNGGEAEEGVGEEVTAEEDAEA